MADPSAGVDEGRLLGLLTQAVARYSPSYAEEGVTEVFERALLRAGLEVRRQPVPGRSGSPGRANLIATLGPQPPELMWLGHLDTVPLQDDEPLGPRRVGDRLEGLGTADMKGACAAAVEALLVTAAQPGPRRRGVAVALVVGEEEYGDGAEVLAAELTAPLVVVGEPTALVPCLAHAGYLEGVMEARGRRAHAALPDAGASATHALLDWWQYAVTAVTALGVPPAVAVNLRKIQGGDSRFMVAEECRAVVDLHLSPELSLGRVEEALAEAVREARRAHVEVDLHWRNRFRSPGFTGSAGDPRLAPLWQALAACGLPSEPGVFRSHSDAPLWARLGCAVAVVGPGRLEVAHTPGEHVSLEEVAAAARLYATLMTRVLTSPG